MEKALERDEENVMREREKEREEGRMGRGMLGACLED